MKIPSSILIKADRFLKYVPLVGTLSTSIGFIVKKSLPKFPTKLNSYQLHVRNKPKKDYAALIPIIGTIVLIFCKIFKIYPAISAEQF